MEGSRMNTRLGRLWIGLSQGNPGLLINCWVIGGIWKPYVSSLNGGRVAWYSTRSDIVTDQNVGGLWSMPAQLKQKTVRKTTVLEWFENMKCLSLSVCHLAVFQSWTSYLTSSERGESGLSADKFFFEIYPANSYFQAYFWVVLGSTNLTPHFGLSLCDFLEDIKLP